MKRATLAMIGGYAAVFAAVLAMALYFGAGMKDAALCLENRNAASKDFYAAKAAACTRRIESFVTGGERLTEFYRERGFAHMDLSQPGEALADLNKVVQRTPGNAASLSQRSDVLFELGRYDSAIADLDTIAQRGANAALLNQRCWYRAAWNHELPQALADCDAALKASPNSAAILDSRGFVHFRLGDFKAAVADYDAALKLRPGAPTSLYVRGLARKRLGDTGGDGDIAAALALRRDVTKDFDKMGIRP